MVTKRKRGRDSMEGAESQGGRSRAEIEEQEITKSWQEVLGPQPPMGKTKVGVKAEEKTITS